ncbi:hypothetical protein SVIOM74S_02208 [Streptomyces violarus]
MAHLLALLHDPLQRPLPDLAGGEPHFAGR